MPDIDVKPSNDNIQFQNYLKTICQNIIISTMSVSNKIENGKREGVEETTEGQLPVK